MKKTIFGLDQICEIIPHRPPFLFVDRVIQFTPGKRIVAERTLQPDEPWFVGHFPQKAIMPGVLVIDALAQTSGLLLGFTKKTQTDTAPSPLSLFYLASSDMKFINPAFPGETLQLFSEKKDTFGSLYSYAVEATAGRKVIAKGRLTLAQVLKL